MVPALRSSSSSRATPAVKMAWPGAAYLCTIRSVVMLALPDKAADAYLYGTMHVRWLPQNLGQIMFYAEFVSWTVRCG